MIQNDSQVVPKVKNYFQMVSNTSHKLSQLTTKWSQMANKWSKVTQFVINNSVTVPNGWTHMSSELSQMTLK